MTNLSRKIAKINLWDCIFFNASIVICIALCNYTYALTFSNGMITHLIYFKDVFALFLCLRLNFSTLSTPYKILTILQQKI